MRKNTKVNTKSNIKDSKNWADVIDAYGNSLRTEMHQDDEYVWYDKIQELFGSETDMLKYYINKDINKYKAQEMMDDYINAIIQGSRYVELDQDILDICDYLIKLGAKLPYDIILAPNELSSLEDNFEDNGIDPEDEGYNYNVRGWLIDNYAPTDPIFQKLLDKIKWSSYEELDMEDSPQYPAQILKYNSEYLKNLK